MRLLLPFLLLLFSCVKAHETSSEPKPVKTKLKAKEALKYCKKKNYSEQYCILIDMSIHSGRKRMFVWDLKKDTAIYSCLVTHGCGSSIWSMGLTKESPSFSNTPESHMSSLGKYRIGERGYSNWGIHVKYLLHGLDTTNSNALKRTIVLHSWDEVEDEEIYPSGSPESWGCPAVSNNSMKQLDSILKKQEKAVLMWVYM